MRHDAPLRAEPASRRSDHHPAGPGDLPAPPPSDCPKCREPIEPADRIRKVLTGWFHAECAREVIATMGNSNLWLMLAEQVAARPSAFKTSEIRAIVRAVIEIAESTTFDESDVDAVWGGAS